MGNSAGAKSQDLSIDERFHNLEDEPVPPPPQDPPQSGCLGQSSDSKTSPKSPTGSKSSALARRLRFSTRKATTPRARTDKVKSLITSHGKEESYFDRAARRNPEDFQQIRSAVREEVVAYETDPEVKAERLRDRQKRAQTVGVVPLEAESIDTPDDQVVRNIKVAVKDHIKTQPPERPSSEEACNNSAAVERFLSAAPEEQG